MSCNKPARLAASYVEYYQTVKYLINFIGEFMAGDKMYEYADYREFAEKVINLIGDLIDDYVATDKLASRDQFVDQGPVTEQVSEKLTQVRAQIRQSVEQKDLNLRVFSNLVSFIETTIDQDYDD